MKHRFDHTRLRGEWSKYFLSNIRFGNAAARILENVRAWLDENIPDDGRCMIVSSGGTMAIYIRDDEDAVLFELSHSFPVGVKRGKKVWV